jgi:hypothetical protein
MTPAQIAEQAIAAAHAGAAILHLHARDPETGAPTPDPDVFAQFLVRIRSECETRAWRPAPPGGRPPGDGLPLSTLRPLPRSSRSLSSSALEPTTKST